MAKMMINGVLQDVPDVTLEARSRRDKKVEVEINGRRIRVMSHKVDDMIRLFGATKIKREYKNPPIELNLPPARTILPPTTDLPSVTEPLPAPQDAILPPMQTTKTKRKTPVRSKSKK